MPKAERYPRSVSHSTKKTKRTVAAKNGATFPRSRRPSGPPSIPQTSAGAARSARKQRIDPKKSHLKSTRTTPLLLSR
ncbi:MAG: hypothetical protein A3B37_02610 [Candidatus Sungbacteria bacterium RIFCSPLOWO2_01_FULL_59_16]|uniref:Uncharacterized protein n=1 Tax=Candidatus Sungbacteria bacterium RIFCSPLOWO2_01_FULL_59_16 TaxID=1802280 RepID=A0A1G2LD39_9BACT|nr:MAG: hypothetical protein A3B37_02610 [Candidatus Sungbacteria bacterium RIFCSPLOWO2_01_FULL_59_16]